MKHYYEKNIVEIKNEYTECLLNILTPLLYEGINSIYKTALTKEEEIIKSSKLDDNIKNPGILKLFQILLKDVPNLNNANIESEVLRIKEQSKCSEWFDLLVKSTIKSYIILLTFNSYTKSKIVEDKYHDNIDINLFVHKCYIESCKNIYNNPNLFWHKYDNIQLKNNQKEIYLLINNGIKEAIRKSLPMKLILNEYMSKDYELELENIKNELMNNNYLLHNQNKQNGGISNNINKDNLEKKKYIPISKILDSDDNNNLEKQLDDIQNDILISEKIENMHEKLNNNIIRSITASENNNKSDYKEVVIDKMMINSSDNNQDDNNQNDNNEDDKDNKDEHDGIDKPFYIDLKTNTKKKGDISFFKDEISKTNKLNSNSNTPNNNIRKIPEISKSRKKFNRASNEYREDIISNKTEYILKSDE